MKNAEPGAMTAALDPAIELLGVVDLLGADGRAPLTGRARDYAASLRRACAPYRSHPAVRLNARLEKSDLDFFQRKTLLLMRSAPPSLEFDPALEAGKGEAERSGAWEPWLAALRDFARASRFAASFGRAARLLKPELDGLNARLAATDYTGRIERYTGLPYLGRYRIVYSPLCARGRSLNRVWTRDDGRHDIVSVLEADPHPGPADPADHSLDAVLWHELGHGVMDMTVNLYDHERRDTPLSLGPRLAGNCRNWLHGMREHLVRAVMLRLIARERGEEAAAKEYRLEEFSAKPHLAAFLAKLREYEASRRRCPNLADFYPRLAAAFPRPAAAALPPPPVDDGRDSWHDALRRLAGPFYTPAQRARAVAHLDLMLERSRDVRLVLRRAALKFLLEDRGGAAEDASALLARRPKVDAVIGAWGAALLKKARNPFTATARANRQE